MNQYCIWTWSAENINLLNLWALEKVWIARKLVAFVSGVGKVGNGRRNAIHESNRDYLDA